MSRVPYRNIFIWLMLLFVAAFIIWGATEWWEARERHHIEVIEQPEKDHLLFYIFGDSGTGGPAQAQMAEILEKECEKARPDGILLLGDNFYQKGVSSVEDPQWEEKLFRPYGKPCIGTVPIFAVLGNHDYKGNVEAQIAMTNVEERWHMPQRFYRINFGSLLQVVAMDTNRITFCLDPNICSLDFLKDSLASKDDFRWNIVMGHHPVKSASLKYNKSSHMIGDSIRSKIMRHYICGKADAYLAGHAHHLEHRHEKDCQTDLFISGAGGAELYGVMPQPESLFTASQHGFIMLDVSQESLVWRVIGEDGTTLYQTVSHK